MDYKTAAALYAQRLKTALDIHRHALALTELTQAIEAGVTETHTEKLRKAALPAATLMRRLERGEFRIAVVGLEKAGKSTFVNAWLGCDLLPAKQERCTFTTTQIYSVQQENQQRLETEPKSIQEFTNYRADLEKQKTSQDTQARQTAEKDLQVINENLTTLNEVLSEGVKTFSFLHLESIKNELTKYVADERYAHAMREARLYTRELAAVDGVVFFDVPGLNSGLSKHIEETKQILADCDAIIVIQSRTISLQAHEQDVVKFGEGGDPYLKLADKLFVFWGQMDLQPSKEVLEANWQKVVAEWQKFGIPEKRMVHGSAGAHLVLQGYPLEQVGDQDFVIAKMQKLTGLNELEALKNATGIHALQQKVKVYLDTERTLLLDKRCQSMLSDIEETARDIFRIVKQRYPTDPDEAKRAQQNYRNILWGEWWNNRWEKIEADINNLFKSILEQENGNQSIEDFKKRYHALVREKMKNLSARQPEKRQQIFDASSRKGFDPSKTNFEWREAVYEDVRKMLIEISKDMAIELKSESGQIIREIKRLLWDSAQIEQLLIPDIPQYLKDLERSLNTLFLRFARPIVELLIYAPLESEIRNKITKDLGADVEIIDNYYSGKEVVLSRLKVYVKYGYKLFIDDNKRVEIFGEERVIQQQTGNVANNQTLPKTLVDSGVLKTLPPVDNTEKHSLIKQQNQVIEEVENDLEAFQHYLLNGIFEAAGFKMFCQQELRDLQDNFLKHKGRWEGVARNEWERGNAQLLSELPAELQQREFDTTVCDRLKQLEIALQHS